MWPQLVEELPALYQKGYTVEEQLSQEAYRHMTTTECIKSHVHSL